MDLVALPHAPPAVRGVTDYRGEVIPVVDLRARFGLPEVEPTRRVKWIVVNAGGTCAALVVDDTFGVFGTAGVALRPAPALGGGADIRGVKGVATHGDDMVFVLELRGVAELTSSVALPEMADPRSLLGAKAGQP
jgi:purine-binding chemotaxis protein CheW